MDTAKNEKKNEWSGKAEDTAHHWAEKGQNVVDKAVSQVKNLKPEDIRRSATEFGTRVRDVSNEAYDDTIGYIRRNPVGSAIGLCAFGFFAGLLTGMMKKSA